MRIFLTGANGFLGSALIPELMGAGHSVLGLTRSDAGASALVAAGAEVHRGTLEDLETLRSGARQAEAVIHCAYNNDYSRLEESSRTEEKAIEALGTELVGSDRPLIISSVTGMGAAAPGQIATERHFDPKAPHPRKATEAAGAAAMDRGVNVSFVRLSQVHNALKQGLITHLIEVAREKGTSAYIGNGMNRWPAVHLSDVVRLYRLALEKPVPGARYHAVAEEGIPLLEIAEAIGKGLKVPVVSISPEEARARFGPFSMLAGMDMPASSSLTRQRVNWQPTGPSLHHDLEQYFRSWEPDQAQARVPPFRPASF